MKNKIPIVLLLGLSLSLTAQAAYVAHEWGTFTSVQGGDGELIRWQPLETTVLPGFVYDWNKVQAQMPAGQPMPLAKRDYTALQRLETPVIYFYGDEATAVNVSVKFPKGLITEWYPKGNAGAAAPPAARDSQLTWPKVNLLPAVAHPELAQSLPMDKTGSHYFAARGADSDYVRIDAQPNGPAPEFEKYLFYRGIGSFTTPLKVTMETQDQLTLENNGKVPLTHLLVLTIHQTGSTLTEVKQICAGESQTVFLAASQKIADGGTGTYLKDRMTEALVSSGLYPAEAAAMVRTWEDSWFAERGVRVLYLLPRAWTDETLPLKLKPAPSEIVRVMVGRAEVITPDTQRSLAESLARAERGDIAARQQASVLLTGLGRFREAAIRLVTRNQTPKASQFAWTFAQNVQRQPAATVSSLP